MIWLDRPTQRGYSLYVEEHTLRTTKVLRQIGCSARHFRRNFASPAPSPNQDKTIELIFFKNRADNFFLEIGQYGYQKTQNFTLIPNPKAKFKKNAGQKSYYQKTAFLLV